MNARNTKIKMISSSKSRGFLGSIPKQVALWRVRMTVTMQSCKKPLFIAKNPIILPCYLHVFSRVVMLDSCFKLQKNCKINECKAFFFYGILESENLKNRGVRDEVFLSMRKIFECLNSKIKAPLFYKKQEDKILKRSTNLVLLNCALSVFQN